MAEPSAQIPDVGEQDIFFFCPACAKSMVIDFRAIGLLVDCPNCRQEVEVPATSQTTPPPTAIIPPDADGEERIEALTKALEVAHSDIQRLTSHLTEVSKRRKYLEQLRAVNIRRLEQIAEQMSVMQAAIDSIVGILHDSASEEPQIER